MKARTLLSAVVLSILPALPALAEEKIPWPEHPRPDFERAAWVNLNGPWSFAFDPQDVGEKEGWARPGHAFDRRIVVPFPWESKLSGIGDTEYKGVAWYAREVTIPSGQGWDGRAAWLIIGACDFETKVFVNGTLAAEHVGGYLPIEVNLSRFAGPGEKVHIAIRARDITDPQQPTGKQVHWYTRNSGIWQTVYLEARHPSHIRSFQCFPNKEGSATFKVTLTPSEGKRYLSIMSPDGRFDPVNMWCPFEETTFELTVKVRNPELWSPANPVLYPVNINLADGEGVLDTVTSYFGLREISVGQAPPLADGIPNAPKRDYKYIYLNGRPIYLMGLLHQSFHPGAIYQYPDDATMRSDYELCRKTGINFVRIHIKTPIPRELYWADKVGVMVMQDIPNFWHHSPQAREWFEPMLRGAIARDFNHPSIFSWVNFNETWGLSNPGPYEGERFDWVAEMYRLSKQLDPTRLVEDNSPCYYDHVVTDINSWHFYINDYDAARKHLEEVVEKTHPGSTFNYAKGFQQSDAPLINSEYGGISAGLGDQDISWSFKYLTNELRRHDKICGYIYTELSDIEWEHNGYVNYDRSPKEFGYDYWFPGFSLKDLNNPDFVVIDAPPMIDVESGKELRVPIRISHWSRREAKNLKLQWAIRWPTAEPDPLAPQIHWQTRPATWQPYAVIEQEPLVFPSLSTPAAVGALLVQLVDGENVIARNYVNLRTREEPPARVYARGVDRVMMWFSPGEYAQATFESILPPLAAQPGDWVGGRGAGYIQYDLRLPDGIDFSEVEQLSLTAEIASRGVDEKLDWPQRRTSHDRPQTDARKWPSDLRVTINSVELFTGRLPDDPADARGALSHAAGLQGGWGYLLTPPPLERAKLREVEKALGTDRLLRVRFEVPADAEHKGGLTLYGRGLGMHGIPPTVALTFKSEHGLPDNFRQESSPAVNRASEQITIPIVTAEARGHEWFYTVIEPGEGWNKPDFDTTGWRKGRGGFGTRETPNSIIGTRWRGQNIWLRTEIELDDPSQFASGSWRLYHDEDVEIFVNGRPVLRREGYVTQYFDVPLSTDALRALRPGRNTIAVHCRQTTGGQYVDVGLTLVKRPRTNASR